MLNRFLPLPEPVQGQTHQLPALGKLWRLLHNRPKRRASVGEALSFEGLCPFMETPDERLRAGFTDHFLESDGRILYRMRTTGEPASITGWSTLTAACDRPVGLPLKIRGRWKITLALRPLRLLRRLGRPLGLATGSLGFALLVLLALGDGLGILVLHVPGTAASDAAPLLRAGKIAIRTTLVAAAALVAIVPSGAAALRAPIIVAPRPRTASLALRTARLATLTATRGGAATTRLVARPR